MSKFYDADRRLLTTVAAHPYATRATIVTSTTTVRLAVGVWLAYTFPIAAIFWIAFTARIGKQTRKDAQ